MTEPDEPLPELLQRVADVAGAVVAYKFAEAFGGTKIYLPATVQEDSKLARAVGAAAAEKIVKEVGSGHILVPLGPHATHTRVRRAIRQQLKAGLSTARVARQLGCHERTVERVRRDLREAEEPPLLEYIRRR